LYQRVGTASEDGIGIISVEEIGGFSNIFVRRA